PHRASQLPSTPPFRSRWLSVFDGKLPIRIVVAEYLRARYGEHARVPFLTFHRHVQEEIAGDAPSGADLRTFVGRSAAIWAPPLADRKSTSELQSREKL